MLQFLEAQKKNIISFISSNYIKDMSDKEQIIKNAYIAYGFPGNNL